MLFLLRMLYNLFPDIFYSSCSFDTNLRYASFPIKLNQPVSQRRDIILRNVFFIDMRLNLNDRSIASFIIQEQLHGIVERIKTNQAI